MRPLVRCVINKFALMQAVSFVLYRLPQAQIGQLDYDVRKLRCLVVYSATALVLAHFEVYDYEYVRIVIISCCHCTITTREYRGYPVAGGDRQHSGSQ